MSHPVGTMNSSENTLNDKHVEHARHSEDPDMTSFSGVNSNDGTLPWLVRSPVVVAQLVDAFIELISDFGAPLPVQLSFSHNATAFLSCSDEVQYWGRAKNLVCFFKAVYLRCTPPDVTGYRFCGAWKRWAKSRMHFNRRNTALWASTFKIKNAAARLSERAAVVTMHKHRLAISTAVGGSEEEISRTVDSISPILESASEFIRKDFESGSWLLPVAASNSASYNHSRGKFGQVGEFLTKIFGHGSVFACPGIGYAGLGPQMLIRSEQFEGFDAYEERVSLLDKMEDPSVKTVKFYESITIDGITYENSWFTTYHFPTTESYWMNEIWIDALRCMDKDMALAKVAAVLEPFKVRIITKGEASLQYLSSHFQKAIFDFNRRLPCFLLVGSRPSAPHLLDLMENCGINSAESPMFRRDPDDVIFASSDFSGASDKTRGLYRDKIMDKLLEGLPEDWRCLLEMCNGPHVVTYPGDFFYPSMSELGKVKPCVQLDGTLMGEKTSFPILNYEVLGAHVVNLRNCGDSRPLDDIIRGVHINGDDRLAVSLEWIEREFWRFCSAHLGFTESIGKSYVHRTYANINSQSYIVSFPNRTVWKVPVRASGLEHGIKKLDKPFNPAMVITEILDGCFDSAMEWTVLQRFMCRHAAKLKSSLGGRNAFLPCCFGGTGNRLPVRHGPKRCRRANGQVCGHASGQTWDPHLTREQQEIASCIASRPGNSTSMYGPQLPLTPDLPQVLDVPWDVFGKPTYWELTESEIQQAGVIFAETRLEVELRTIGEKYDKDTLRGASVLLSSKNLFCSKIIQLWSSEPETTERTDIRSSFEKIWHCLRPGCWESNRIDQDTCVCKGTKWAFICAVCESYNVAVGVPCDVCELIEHPKCLVRTQIWPTYRLVDLPPENLSNCDLSSKKINSLGYGISPLDEFDTELYSFAIDCARFEHLGQPTVRFRGRAVDLFGTNPGWFPLRPATLTW